MKPLTSLGHYRVVLATEQAAAIAADLIADPVPYLAIRRDGTWVIRSVDEALIRKLAGSMNTSLTLEDALGLANEKRDQSVKLLELMKKDRNGGLESAPSKLARVVVDKNDMARTLIASDTDADEHLLYPLVKTKHKSVAPDEEIEVELQFETAATQYVAAALTVPFEPGETEIVLEVAVSSSSFETPAGTRWSKKFLVDKDLSTQPGTWAFKAIARREALRYTLRVAFTARGQSLGSVVVVLPRTGTQLPASTSSSGPLTMPAPEATTSLLLTITDEGATYRSISASIGGKTLVEGARWNVAAEAGYFATLESAKTRDRIQQIGTGLFGDLPPAIQELLTEQTDTPITICSGVPYAPFEIANIPIHRGELLGVMRPVMRANPDARTSTVRRRSLAAPLCVRPAYAGSDDLPSAADEETYLRSNIVTTRMAPTEAELRALLEDGTIGVVHFAGHAQTNPPLLKLQGSEIPPTFFARTSPLMKSQPFFFVNGCQAGAGRPGTAAEQGNMVKGLLTYGASCIIAPVIFVQSRGALEVAKTFYEAVRTQTVGNAMLKVRQAALAADEQLAGTYLSYLAFGVPEYRLDWPA